MRTRAGMLAAVLLLWPSAAGAEGEAGTVEDMDRVQRSIEESTDLRRQLDRQLGRLGQEVAALRAQTINLSMDIMAQHEVLLEIERAMTVLRAEEAERIAKLGAQRDKLSLLLGGLTRIARVPPETMVARPSAPVETLRTTMLLRAAVPAIEDEARILRRQLSDLAAVRADLSARQAEAAEKRDELDGRIATLNTLIRRREEHLSEAETQRRAVEDRLQSLAAEADSLRDLLARLESEPRAADLLDPPAGPAAPDEADADEAGRELVDGHVASLLAALPVLDGVILPASGEIAVRYGQPNAFGETNRGLTLRPYPGAPVVAPLDGEVRFAGTFRGYGELLILEHPGGYHSLIAGFGRLDARVGQQVLAGEPVGVTALPQTGTTDNPTLYFEFRSNGQPINPVQGLAMARESVRG